LIQLTHSAKAEVTGEEDSCIGDTIGMELQCNCATMSMSFGTQAATTSHLQIVALLESCCFRRSGRM
jgi:hypothetical protein